MTDTADFLSPEAIVQAVRAIEADSPLSVEVLCMAVMLAPEPLPLDFALTLDGASHNPALLNPAAAIFAVAATLDPVLNSGFMEQDLATDTLSVPEHVRRALRESMTPEQARDWASRAMYALNLVLPDVDQEIWDRVDFLLPHVRVCADLVRELGVNTAAANRVLHQTGYALHMQDRNEEAVPFVEAALNVDVAVKGEMHPEIAGDYEGLGMVCLAAGLSEKAAGALERSLHVYEAVFTENNPAMAPVLNMLGVVRMRLGEFDAAARCLERCRVVLEAGAPDDPALATCLTNLAHAREALGQQAEARVLAEAALPLMEDLAGPESPVLLELLYLLARLHLANGDADRAEQAHDRAVRVATGAFGPDTVMTSRALCLRGLFLDTVGRRDEALEGFRAGLAVLQGELSLGPDTPDEALDLCVDLLERVRDHDGLRELAHAALHQVVSR